MDKTLTFSIILCIYNVDKYLNRCLVSLMNQDFLNFEVIMVDDHSLDNSAEICKSYQKKDGRFHYMRLEKNGGSSNARNQGFKQAKGKYVLFLDSDDYVDSNLLSTLYKNLSISNPDLAVYGFYEEYSKNENIYYKKEFSVPSVVCTSKDEIDRELIDLEMATMFGYPWNKCYRTDIIRNNKLEFENFSLNEDFFFNLKYLRFVNTMSVFSNSLYHYAIRQSGSLTSKYVEDYADTHFKRISQLIDYFADSETSIKENAYQALSNRYARYVLSSIVRNYNHNSGMNHKEKKNWVRRCFKSKEYKVLKKYYEPKNIPLAILYFPIFKGLSSLSLFEAWLIYAVKEKFPFLFIKAKQNR